MIFAVKVSSTDQGLSDLSPSILEYPLAEEENPVFLWWPGKFDDKWSELVMPAFPDLFATALLNLHRQVIPILRAIVGN